MKPAKAYWNVLKMRLNIRLRREVVRNYPIAAFIEPTSYCNLRCPSCPTGLHLDLRPTVAIDETFFRATIDEIGDFLFQLFLYNWGEPLLHKRTPELVAYAKTKDITTILSTNLSIRLTDDYLERLVRSGLDTLLVSLDGVTEETYSKYRRHGQFELVRDNLRRLREIKDRLGMQTPKLVWQFVVFRHNEHEIEEARAVHKAWGADAISVIPAIMPAAPHDEGFQPSTIPEYNMYHSEHSVQREATRQMKEGKSCSWLYGMLVLNPGGSVSPCCSVPSQQHDFGLLDAPRNFNDLWNNATFRRARRLFTGRGAEGHADPKLLNGMAAGNTTHGDALVCESCPIPFMQNYTDGIVDGVLAKLGRALIYEKSPRAMLNYLLMGAPFPSRPLFRRLLRAFA